MSSNAKKAATPKKVTATEIRENATAFVDALNARAPKKRTKKSVETVIEKVAETVDVQPKKAISNTQACANMILSLAKDAKHTRAQIIESVSEALSALSVVTVKTMMSDLQNAKYAKRYSSHTIAVDKSTKIVSVACEIKA